MNSTKETQGFVLKSILNLACLNCAFLLAYNLSFNNPFSLREVNSNADYNSLLLIANLLVLGINSVFNTTQRRELRKYSIFLLTYLCIMVFIERYNYSRAFHVYFQAFYFTFIVFLKFSNFNSLLERYFLPKDLERKILLIGGEFDFSIVQYISEQPGNYRCVGWLRNTESPSEDDGDFYRGRIDELEELLSKNTFDGLLISSASVALADLDNAIKIAEKYHTTVSMLPPYFQYLSQQVCHTEEWLGVPIISVHHTKLAIKYHQITKRVLDVLVSLLILIFIFPLLCLFVIPAIWLNNRGPVFFVQLRKGYKQKPFHCYKFRTMKLDTEIPEEVQAQKQDERVTRIGQTLRKNSIDEIPQFYNVLVGHMSVVGPRPHMVEHDNLYDKFISRYNVRFVTKPGITGWAQINGLRGGTEDPGLMNKRIEHDLWYIKNWSLWLDIKIIALTVSKLLLKGDKNAY